MAGDGANEGGRTHSALADSTEQDQERRAIRVFIADTHPLYRAGIRTVLKQDERFQVVGDVSDGGLLLSGVAARGPDVLLLDVHVAMADQGRARGDGEPAADGLGLARLVKERCPELAVIMLATQEHEELLFQAMRVGAAAFCLRDLSADELVSVITRVHRGDYLLTDSALQRLSVAASVVRQFRELSATEEVQEPILVPLSARELQILQQIARGHSNKEIAKTLGISDQTVKNHITSILRKLQVNDRTQAVVYALRHGWIKMQEV